MQLKNLATQLMLVLIKALWPDFPPMTFKSLGMAGSVRDKKVRAVFFFLPFT